MADSPTNELSLLITALKHLSSEKPFRKKLFASEDDSDIQFFGRTDEVKKILTHIDSRTGEATSGRLHHVVCVRAQRGNGKTTLFRYLDRKLTLENGKILTVYIPDLEAKPADVGDIVFLMVTYMFLAMFNNGLMEKDAFNNMDAARKAADSTQKKQRFMLDQLTRIAPQLQKITIIWLCDEVCSTKCFDACQDLLSLKSDDLPPQVFFEKITCVVALATREYAVQKFWTANLKDDPVHDFRWLGVSASDALQVATSLLQAAYLSIEPKKLTLIKTEWKDNATFPIDRHQLDTYLKFKEKRKPITSERHNFEDEVYELSLSNVLKGLDQVVDDESKSDSPTKIDLKQLVEWDVGAQ